MSFARFVRKLRRNFSESSEIQAFFPPKNKWSPKKKKKVFTEIETDFSAKIENSNVFSAQKQVVSKKKRSSTKLRLIFRPKSEIQTSFSAQKQVVSKNKKKRSSPKLRLIFRPKSEIQTLFHSESRHLLHNFGTQFPLGGAVFNFSPNIGLKSTKNVRCCILHKPMGGARALPRPPWLRY